MLINSNIKELYNEIRQTIFYMIPEKWDSIYLYAAITERENSGETGEMFFYYFPKSILKKNPINVYQIPQKFSIKEEDYTNLTNKLYDLIKKLRKAYITYEKTKWSNITISIKDVKFLAELNCENLLSSKYNSENRVLIWQYKYLEYPIEKFTKEQRKIIEEYIEEEERGLHKVKTYSDSFYKPHMHNNLQYDREKNIEYYVHNDVEHNKEEIAEEKAIRNQILKC